MKRIEVVAAIIRKDGKIFATQRGYGDFKDWWEFPGGKIESGESPEQFHLTLHCYLCALASDSLHLNEHEAARWLAKDDIYTVKWLPADEEVLEMLAES